MKLRGFFTIEGSDYGDLTAVITLASYVLSVQRKAPRTFHLGNTIGVEGIAASAIAAGAWPSLAVTLSFGAIGAWGLWAP